MNVTAISFDHLLRAEDERLMRELEYRRIALERGGAALDSGPARLIRGIMRRLHRPARGRSAVLAPSR
jgi:hypothetical protein